MEKDTGFSSTRIAGFSTLTLSNDGMTVNNIKLISTGWQHYRRMVRMGGRTALRKKAKMSTPMLLSGQR